MSSPGPRLTAFDVQTRSASQMVDVTAQVADVVRRRAFVDGMIVVFVPHTTAGVTIQENADPDVKTDFLAKLDRLVPAGESFYRHAEGNSHSHLRASFVGSSATVIVENRRLMLGRWQGIYLCEFDGPRTREVWVKPLVTGLER